MGSCSLTAPVLLRNQVHFAFILIVTVVLTVINKIVYEMMTRFFSHPSYVMLWPEFNNANTAYSQISVSQPFKISCLPDYFYSAWVDFYPTVDASHSTFCGSFYFNFYPYYLQH